MTVFVYKALDERGLKRKGVLEAESPRQLRQQLHLRGWMPLSVEEGSRTSRMFSGLTKPRSAFTARALTSFTRELAILLEGGLPLEKALKLIAMQMTHLPMRECLLAVHAQVVGGSSFARSLVAYPENFPPLYRATVTAGERAGNLSGVLDKLATYGETHQRTLSRVKLAMVYPVILTAFSILVVTGLMVYVFPDITRIFIQSGHTLPPLTRTLIVISDVLRHFGWLILLLLALATVAIRQALTRPETALNVHRYLLKLPLVAPLIMAFNMARFTSTLSMLRNSGVPLAEALKEASQVLGNRWLRQGAEQVTLSVMEGKSLHQALLQTNIFPPSFISMIAGGEASGELDRVLQLAAHNQMREMETRMLFGVAILEPVIILLLGMVILMVVLAIMMPILSMNQLVK